MACALGAGIGLAIVACSAFSSDDSPSGTTEAGADAEQSETTPGDGGLIFDGRIWRGESGMSW